MLTKTWVGLEKWHEFVSNRNEQTLEEALSDNIIFHSPFVWKPKHGKLAAMQVLTNVVQVFQDFTYHRYFFSETGATLEFSAKVGDLTVKGVDLLEFDEDGKIKDFEVLVRPANGLQALGAEMTRRLTQN